MLKIYDMWFEEDSSAWRKLQRNFCNSLLECMEASWIEAFPEAYFPRQWDCKMSRAVIGELLRKLESDDQEELTDLESYVLYSVIKKVCEYQNHTEGTCFMGIDECEAIIAEFDAEDEYGADIVSDYEDMRFWPRFCFSNDKLQTLDALAAEERLNCCIG